MKVINNIKHGWKNEGFARIRKYMKKPAIIAFAIADAVVFLLVLILLITGRLEDMIVSMNVRYNSPVFAVLAVAFLVVLAGAAGYGIVLSLRKYRRPSGKGVFRPSYENGSSYKALNGNLNYGSELKIKL